MFWSEIGSGLGQQGRRQVNVHFQEFQANVSELFEVFSSSDGSNWTLSFKPCH